jgi:hypothetical protein
MKTLAQIKETSKEEFIKNHCHDWALMDDAGVIYI